MLKNFFGVVLATASLLSFNLPIHADDTIYPVSVQNYLNQLALESQWIREKGTGKRYHLIASVPTEKLVALSTKVCLNFTSGQPFSVIKPIVKADSLLMLPSNVSVRLSNSGINRFADVAIKSAVNNRCPQFNSTLPLVKYILPSAGDILPSDIIPSI